MIRRYTTIFTIIIIYTIVLIASFYNPNDPKKFIFFFTNLPGSPLSEQINLIYSLMINYFFFLLVGFVLIRLKISCKINIIFLLIIFLRILNSIISDGMVDFNGLIFIFLTSFPIFIAIILIYAIFKFIFIGIVFLWHKIIGRDYIS